MTAAAPAQLTNAQLAAGWVYFIQAGGDTGPIKIGRAKDPVARLKTLQGANSEELELLAVCPANDRAELDLHDMFACGRIRGEWFEPDPDLLEMVLWCAVFWCDEYQAMLR